MAIFQLSSTNPAFSQLIRKHPLGGMRGDHIKLGTAFGWYSYENTAYNIYFRDVENEVSFKEYENQAFEYLNVSRYNSPLFYLHTLKSFFASAYKTKNELDAHGFQNTCYLNLIRIKRPSLIQKLKDYFPEFKVALSPHEGLSKDFTLKIQTDRSLYEFLHFVDLFCLFIAATNRDYFYTDTSLLKKYLSSLEVIDAPYFFRYVFKLHLIWKKSDFNQFKSWLERSEKQKIHMTFGNNLQARKRFVDAHLDLEKPIFDVGCGEGYYTLNYARKTENVIHAVDVDEEILAITKQKAEKRGLNNIVFHSHSETLPDDLSPQIILTEVIEHMPLKEAEELIIFLITRKPEKLILTTPNKDFNAFYFEDEEEMRHHDHDFELSKKEFEIWTKGLIQKIKKKNQSIDIIDAQFQDVGDVVNDHPTTLGVILKFVYQS